MPTFLKFVNSLKRHGEEFPSALLLLAAVTVKRTEPSVRIGRAPFKDAASDVIVTACFVCPRVSERQTAAASRRHAVRQALQAAEDVR